ncbi:response regulator [Ferruginibacter sp.]|uniref:response regulator n=1 Tax=Ferruginibacter sp. TaxID=1940288 RepID=UPI00265AAE1F|nr:response regulator [Ferruginibacter sp.]
MMHRSKRVMIADDDPGILDCLSIMLEYDGYEVSSTLNGSNLLRLGDDLPDLLLLDTWMSGVDGRNVCAYLKGNELTKKMPIIMISASKDVEASALQAGADAFLEKPFEMDDLLSKVAQYIG